MTHTILTNLAIHDGEETLVVQGSTNFEAAQEMMRKILRERWDAEMGDLPFPEDIEEAKDQLTSGIACFDDSFWLTDVYIQSSELSELVEAAELVAATTKPSSEHLVRLRKALIAASREKGGPLIEELPVFQSFDGEIDGSQDVAHGDAIPLTTKFRIHYHEAQKMAKIAMLCQEGAQHSGQLKADEACALLDEAAELVSTNVEYQVYGKTFRVRGEENETHEAWFSQEISLNDVFKHFELPTI
ncbi:MAG: hypothetical protein ACFHHU_00340 [Porticoccaceae bacterium]